MAAFRSLLIALLAMSPFGLAGSAFAQSAVPIVTSSCGTTNGQTLSPSRNASPYEDTTGKGCVNATFSGTVSTAAFAPTGQASLAASTVTSNVAFGSAGPTAVITNNGSVTAYLNFGNGSVTATTSGYPINSGQSIAFNIGSNTNVAGITATGSAPLSITTGTGTPTLAGGSTSAAPVNVTVNSPPNDVLTGPITCTAACAATTQVNSQGAGSVGIVATGSGTGLSYTFQASLDGTTWFSVAAYTPAAAIVQPGTPITTAAGQWTVPASGWRFVRVNLTAISGGSEVFNVNSSAGSVVPPGAAITVNAPPNDVLQGPTSFTGAGDIIVNSQGAGSVGLQITGTFTGLSGLVRASIDGTNYFNVPAFNTTTGTAVTPGTAITAGGSWFVPAAGWRFVEYHITAVSTGTAVASLNSSAGSIQPLITPSGAPGVDVLGLNGATVSTGNGPSDTHTMRVAVAPGGSIAISGPIGTGAPSVGVTTTLDTTDAAALQTIASNTGASIPAGTALIGSTNSCASCGGTVTSIIVANNTTSVAVCAAACTITSVDASSISAATPVFVKLYNVAQASQTCGSGTPRERAMIPAPGASGGGTNIPMNDAYGTAASVCITAGQADNDTTSPAATSYLVNIHHTP